MTKKNGSSHSENSLPLEERAIAVINGKEISRKIFLRQYYEEWEIFQEENPNKDITQVEDEKIKCQVADYLIDREILLQHALSLNISANENIVIEILEDVKSGYEDLLDYKMDLEELESSEEELKQEIRDDIIIKEFINTEKEKKIILDQDTIKDFYKTNKQNLTFDEAVHAGHIFIKVDTSASNEIQKQALNRIQEISKQLKAGENFEELAKKFSECPSAKSGGDLGIIYHGFGEIDEEFERAAFNQEAGSISKPFESSSGFHIVKIYEKMKNYTPDFDHIKDQLAEFIKSELWKDEQDNLIDELREKADIKIFNF